MSEAFDTVDTTVDYW